MKQTAAAINVSAHVGRPVPVFLLAQATVDGVGNVRLPELMFGICEEELALLNVGPSVNKLVSVGICFDPRVDIVFIYFKL